MVEARPGTASVTERIRPVAADAPVVAVHFLEDTCCFVLGEEHVLLAPPDGEPQRLLVHSGGVLAIAADNERVVTAGDDGKVVATNAQGHTRTLVTDPKRRWIDRVAAGPEGAIAWSVAKTVFVQTANRQEKTIELPSSVGGLSFAPRGFRLAVAHYNGVTLWFPNAKAAPERFEWKGSHLDVTFSPDGKFLVTAMQEPTLHGWRLADRKDGPLGKTPKLFAPYEHAVAVVACHPAQDVVAAGYQDGMVLLVRVEDGAEILARAPGAGPVAALAWDSSGTLLAFGTEEGEAGIVDLS